MDIQPIQNGLHSSYNNGILIRPRMEYHKTDQQVMLQVKSLTHFRFHNLPQRSIQFIFRHILQIAEYNRWEFPSFGKNYRYRPIL